jgi:hypothetical protein
MTSHPTKSPLTPLPEPQPKGSRALTLEDRAALLLGETSCSLAAAAQLFPPGRAGRPTHVSTLVRWITRGVLGVRLEALRVGGRWMTSHEACQRFAAALTAKHNAPLIQPKAACPSGAALQRRQERAERELKKIGL